MKINSLKIKHTWRAALFIQCFIASATYAQKVKAEVAVIIDTRVSNRIENSEDASLVVQIEFTGIETGSNSYLKPGKIIRAIDNLGNTFPMDENVYDTYSYNTILNYRLFSTERTATEIRVLEGTVKHFNPTVANKGLINVDKPVDKLGTNILKGKKSDLVLVLLDRKKLQKLKKENIKTYKQELDKLKKEYGSGAESISELDELLDDSDFEGNNELFCFIYDPGEQIWEIKVTNSEGENIAYGSSENGNHLLLDLYENLTNAMKLSITIETPEAVKEYPFKIEKIRLP